MEDEDFGGRPWPPYTGEAEFVDMNPDRKYTGSSVYDEKSARKKNRR